MDEVVNAFASGTGWTWLVLGVVLVTVEVVTPTTYLLWPGIAALIIGLIAMVAGPFDWRIEGLIFAAVSIAATIVWRRYLDGRGAKPTDAPLLNQRAQQYLGRQASVSETFVNGQGTIKLDDTQWRARAVDGTDFEAGTPVVIIEVAGTLMGVRAQSQS
jgi:membrane protein implicated in regulation of membrane protease activity